MSVFINKTFPKIEESFCESGSFSSLLPVGEVAVVNKILFSEIASTLPALIAFSHVFDLKISLNSKFLFVMSA